jgi:hypothetical protein
VAGLTGDPVAVLVERARDVAAVVVGVDAVTGLAGRRLPAHARLTGAVHVPCGHVIAPAGQLVAAGDVAVLAGHVPALGAHVHVERPGRIDQRGIQVAVLGAVAAAAVEVTAAAAGDVGRADVARDLSQVGRGQFLTVHGGRALQHPAGALGRLVVGAGGVVADQTVDPSVVGEVERRVLPAIAGVAGGAARLVGAHVGAEVVQHVPLAELLAGVRVVVVPGPVDRLADLVPGLGVAFQAGFGDLATTVELALEFLELAVVGGRDVLGRRGCGQLPFLGPGGPRQRGGGEQRKDE